jgi:hypothetical protein
MTRVSVVCTVHEETGYANVLELRAILERIQPEVIFLEVPPPAFDDYYENCSQQNLESMAVRQYRRSSGRTGSRGFANAKHRVGICGSHELAMRCTGINRWWM